MKQTLVIVLSISVLLVIVLGVSFYWFQLRPAQIRKDCSIKAESSYVDNIMGKNAVIDNCLKYDICFQKCLSQNGLER